MGPLMHFTSKVQHNGPKTVESITQKPLGEAPLYKDSVNGIVPGYQGHVPGARDSYGQAVIGGLSMEVWHGNHAGPQARREKIGDVQAATSPNKEFKAKVNGVVPGYSGFRTGSIEEYGNSAFGGVAPFATSEQLSNPAALAQGDRALPKVDPNATPSFRDGVHGVLPGYTGFVPNKHSKYGESHWGKVGGMPQGVDAAARSKGDRQVGVDMRVKPGYSAHVPGARDSFGASTSTTYDFINDGY